MDEKEAEARPVMGTIFLVYQTCNSQTLLNLYFSGIPGCVVKGVVSNPLFQIFLDPALKRMLLMLG